MTRANYAVDIDWDFLESWLLSLGGGQKINYDPDYQRDHVWTEEQQIAYVEFRLRGGHSGGKLYWNSPNMYKVNALVDLVDGKQRLTAVLRFLRNEIPCLGCFYKDFEGPLRLTGTTAFRMCVNDLKTRGEVIQWYLDLNAGIAHTDEEIIRVKGLLVLCEENIKSKSQIIAVLTLMRIMVLWKQ